MDVKADPGVLDGDGDLDLDKVRPIVWNASGGAYHRVGEPKGQAFSIGREIRAPPDIR